MTDANDMHQHRRTDDQDDTPRRIVQEIVESTGAKVFARAVVPTLLAIIGFFLVRTLGDVAGNQADLKSNQIEQGRDLTLVKSQMLVMTTRFDEIAVRRIDGNTSRIEVTERKDVEQDRRLDALDRATRTP